VVYLKKQPYENRRNYSHSRYDHKDRYSHSENTHSEAAPTEASENVTYDVVSSDNE
jgi:hypothetical protein